MYGKVCTKCGIEKPISEFGKRSASKDGLRNDCKDCRRQYQQANAEHIRQYKKQYRLDNPDYDKQYRQANAERLKEYDKQRRLDNPERHRLWGKQWRQANIEHVKQYNEQWRETNTEHCKEYARQYRRSEHGRKISYQLNVKRRSYKHKVIFTQFERRKLLDRDNWTCQTCGIKVHDRHTGDWNTEDKAHIDHIIPITKGGDSTPKNLRVLCRTCNLSKYKNQDEQLKLFN